VAEVGLASSEAKLRHYKRQAKALLKGVKGRGRSALSEASLHPRFPEQLEPSEFKLSDAQLVIARQQGFAGWPQLKSAIASMGTLKGAMPMKMNFCTPELPVVSVATALEAFQQLGFRIAWTYEDSFGCVYGGGNIEIFFRRETHPHPVTLYLKVDDADSFYEDYQKHAELVEPIRNTPWGMREFVVRTVDGHLLRVGHGAPDGGDRRVSAKK
jgi:hypothetical protein